MDIHVHLRLGVHSAGAGVVVILRLDEDVGLGGGQDGPVADLDVGGAALDHDGAVGGVELRSLAQDLDGGNHAHGLMGHDAIAVGVGNGAAVEDDGAVDGRKGDDAVMDVELAVGEGIDAGADGVRAIAAFGHIDGAADAGERPVFYRVNAKAAPVAAGEGAVFKILGGIVHHIVQTGVAVDAQTRGGLAHGRARDGSVRVIFSRVADEGGVIDLQRGLPAGKGAAADVAADDGVDIAGDQRGAVGGAQGRALPHKVVAALAGEFDRDVGDLHLGAAGGADAGQGGDAVGLDGHAGNGRVGDLTAHGGGQDGLVLLQAVFGDVDNAGKRGGKVNVLVAALVVGGLVDGLYHVNSDDVVIVADRHGDVHAADGQIGRDALGQLDGILCAVGDIYDGVLVIGHDGVVAGFFLQIAVGGGGRLPGRLPGCFSGCLPGCESGAAEAQEHRQRQRKRQKLFGHFHAVVPPK